MTSAYSQNRAMKLIHSVSLCFYTLFFVLNPISPVFSGKPSFACDLETSPELADFAFCDSSAEIEDRVSDLVGRLTLEEKVQFLGDQQGSVERLGIPVYKWWSEALHGVSDTGRGVNFTQGPIFGATSFPQVILTAASYNTSLFQAIGKVVSTEARAMYNNGVAGLTFWSPNVNILRDPRWGRAQETPGEDPKLSSVYAVAFVQGLQQRDDGDTKRLKVAACCKHYTAYDVDYWKNTVRFTFDAVVTQQDLEDTFNTPFKSCVMEGNVSSVMCSYNKVNGKPTCADYDFLSGVVRGEWHLNGYIVSDCDSVQVFNNIQGYTTTIVEAAAVALNAGLDLDCGDSLQNYTIAAVKLGLVNVSAIDRAVSNNLATLMRLGFFDGNPAKQLYGNLGPSDVCTEANQKLAQEAAQQGIVLLKNELNALPLSPTAIKSLALIGPNANATDTMIGNYAGKPCKYTSPLDGIVSIVPTMYAPGCADVPCTTVQLDDAKKAASLADATILVMGTNLIIENEGLDRVNLTLPGQQQLLVTEVAKVSRGPVILVIMSGGPMDIQFAKESFNVKSILWVGYPGQAGGAAMADVIFGYVSPHGRLPMSWYPQSYADKIPMTNMNMRPDPSTGYPGRTYRFYTGPTLYEFGYSMSYTKFEHQLVQAPEKVSVSLEGHFCLSSSCKSIDVVDEQRCEKLAFEVHLRVKNVGEMSGGHTVLLFSSPPPVHGAPQKHLVAFEKVFLDPQSEETVRFKVDVCKDLSLVDELGKKKIALGEHLIRVGDLSFTLNVMT